MVSRYKWIVVAYWIPNTNCAVTLRLRLPLSVWFSSRMLSGTAERQNVTSADRTP